MEVLLRSVRGVTAEQRAHARRLVRATRRIGFFAEKIRMAADGRSRLAQACDLAKAVGDELDERGRNELAREIAELADRRNPR